MADSLNRFFQEAGNQLNDRLGNPRSGQRPGLNDPDHPSNKHVNNRTGAPDGRALISLQENLSDKNGPQQPGFTPVEYYRSTAPGFSGSDPIFKIVPPSDWEHRNTLDVYNKIASVDGDYDKYNDEKTRSFRFGLNDSNVNTVLKYPESKLTNMNSNEQRFSRIWNYDEGDMLTPNDNEDPVFFGFDIKISADSSPLLNGELEKFLTVDWTDSLDDEILSRREIYAEFKKELTRYFDFNTQDMSKYRDVGSRVSNGDYNSPQTTVIPGSNNPSNGESIPINSIFGSDASFDKKYYVKKIDGLQNLNESNLPNKQKAFTDYGTDVLKITFYEDTTLNLGTLYSLYKLLYWSRLRGKSVIPENLLRFDMTITVSELRNFVAVKKASPENKLELLKANLSKYVYNVYDCQFFFDKPSHPDAIDLSSKPEMTDKYDVNISYKYSTMNFVRYNPSKEDWRMINNIDVTPGPTKFSTVYMPTLSGDGQTPTVLPEVLIIDSNLEKPNIKLNESFPLGYKDVGPTRQEFDSFNQSINNLGDFAKDQKQSATSRLLNGLKSAALNEAQRQLNSRFSLLNNSIDQIRNAFGIGRMPPPTNVYEIPPGGQFFFDVQNSLRNFGGDVLSNFFFGE